jgi:hypothetical protein
MSSNNNPDNNFVDIDDELDNFNLGVPANSHTSHHSLQSSNSPSNQSNMIPTGLFDNKSKGKTPGGRKRKSKRKTRRKSKRRRRKKRKTRRKSKTRRRRRKKRTQKGR